MLVSLARNLRRPPHTPKLVILLQRSLTSTSVASEITADALLSDTNRQRCINCMQGGPPMSKYLKHWNGKQNEREGRFAAVLIAICVDAQGDASILYTRRSGQLRSHVRQISFPGGNMDPTDVDYINCALRETEEEVGLPRSRVEIWGTGALLRPPHTAAIMPVIGVVRDFDLNDLHINEDEVEEAFTVPVARLAEPSSLLYTQFKTGYSAPNFIVDGYKIWGITGFLTNRFINCLLPKDLNKIKNRVRFVAPFRSSK